MPYRIFSWTKFDLIFVNTHFSYLTGWGPLPSQYGSIFGWCVVDKIISSQCFVTHNKNEQKKISFEYKRSGWYAVYNYSPHNDWVSPVNSNVEESNRKNKNNNQ